MTYLGPAGSQIGLKETMKDTARVLGRMYDAIEYRGYGQSIVEELAKYAGVPVYNGLTDEFHPTQVLADAADHGRALHEAARADRILAISATRATTWATRCSPGARSSAWTCASRRRSRAGRTKR